ncbi:MAG TPA: response regulator transcription factor [Stenotrophobium sp.]|jgi:DNA-binding NarL/FixJ family response regulator|nr:response regulator transcription factor [Stenotrophobium sp.]
MNAASGKTTRVILADAQGLVRSGIRALLEALPHTEVVAETGDGHELVTLATQHRPDVVITEIDLAHLGGLEAAAQLQRHCPEVAVLILSRQTAHPLIRAALKAGVCGFLTKNAELPELGLALRAASRRQSYFSPEISRSALEQRRLPRAESRPKFTPRQRQVMQLLARGATTREIAGLMGVSVKTVETHRARVMQQLHLKNANALIHYAIRNGFSDIS